MTDIKVEKEIMENANQYTRCYFVYSYIMIGIKYVILIFCFRVSQTVDVVMHLNDSLMGAT